MPAIAPTGELECDAEVFARRASRNLDGAGKHLAQGVENVVASFAPVPARADRPGDGGDAGRGPSMLGSLVDDGES
jgi:hypothetical protein